MPLAFIEGVLIFMKAALGDRHGAGFQAAAVQLRGEHLTCGFY